MLKKRGIARVRPLLGGLDAWVAAGFPIDSLEPDATPKSDSGTAPLPDPP